jgi:hypothetical protein
MPRATSHRSTTTTAGAGVSLTPPMTMTGGTARTARPAKKGNAGTGKQYLSLERTTANQVIAKDLTAGQLATWVNTICAVEEKQPGIVAKDPLWAYNLGVQMFGGD